jgi:FlaA1/EpsC-like NDP-sugar epimerase
LLTQEYLGFELTPGGRLAHRLYRAAYHWHGAVALLVYGVIALAGYLLAFLLRFDFAIPADYGVTVALSAALLVGTRVVTSARFRLSTGRWRFVSTSDVRRLVVTTLAGSVIFFALVWIIPFAPRVPRSVVLIEWLATTFLTAALWLAYRTGYELLRLQRSRINSSAKRVIIVGAGEAGNLLAREISRFPTGYRAVGFVDDDSARHGLRLQGLRVLGTVSDLARVVREADAEEIIIAAPSASPVELRRIVTVCESTGLPFKVLPGIAEVLAGEVRVAQLREVQIEDLLGREPVHLTLPELATELAGASVLITGAAGSIGSELARQVALHGPGNLVLLDQAETDLYFLEMELRERHPDLKLVPVVGDIVEEASLEQVFRAHSPDLVYHAAAYKHVPMMETNPRQAVRNNVVGTHRVAVAAGRHGALKFVLVSTDKAVRPVSVMGATKRLAELLVLELQDHYPETTYAAVRFGNVLGSNGSVIPIFKRRLADGKPLRVTHPEVTRYFMTIPEAVQLILQASLLPEMRGNIAMLEMGDPVRIVDLARNLLELAGVRQVDDHIVYTGLRPGERLHEELIAGHEYSVATSHPKVHLVRSREANGRAVLEVLEDWTQVLDRLDDVEIANRLRAFFPSLSENGWQTAIGAVPRDSAAPAAAQVRDE